MADQTDFSARADEAMRGLKAKMGLPETPVPNGSSPQAPPPGSYAAQLRQHRQETLGQPPPSIGRDTVETEDGPVGDNGETAAPSQPEQPEATDVGPDGKHVPFKDHPIFNRFAEVSRERTAYKRDLERLKDEHQREAAEAKALRDKVAQQESLLQQMQAQHLEQLSPEDRAAFVARVEIQQGLQSIEQRMTERLQPVMRNLHEERRYRELEHLVHKYPAFDLDKHAPLIDTFREANPACSMEHAFRAVAEDHELGASNGRSARRAPPPVVVPGQPMFAKMDVERSQDKEEQSLIEGARRVRQTATSEDPMVRSGSLGAAAESIRDRYFRRGSGAPR